jgi:hypothetical protein
MTFEDFVKTLHEHQAIPGDVEVPRGTLRVGPAEETAEEAAVLPASAEASEFTNEEIQELQQETG